MEDAEGPQLMAEGLAIRVVAIGFTTVYVSVVVI